MVFKYVFCVLLAIQLINAAVVKSYDNKDTLVELEERIMHIGSTSVRKGEDFKISFHYNTAEIRNTGVGVGAAVLVFYEIYKNGTIDEKGEWARECFEIPPILHDVKAARKELLNDFERCIANATYQVDSIAIKGIRINQDSHDQVSHWDGEYLKCDGDVTCQDGVLDTLKGLAEKFSDELSQFEEAILNFHTHDIDAVGICVSAAYTDLNDNSVEILNVIWNCLSEHQ